MSDKVLEIRDKRGNTFRMKLSMPTSKFIPLKWAKEGKRLLTRGGWFGGAISGDWKAVDEGFIRYRSGKTRSRFSGKGDLTTSDLLILGAAGVKADDGKDTFGMQLFEYEDVLGVNDEGIGFVIQPWVITLTPGRIYWSVIG